MGRRRRGQGQVGAVLRYVRDENIGEGSLRFTVCLFVCLCVVLLPCLEAMPRVKPLESEDEPQSKQRQSSPPCTTLLFICSEVSLQNRTFVCVCVCVRMSRFC